MSTYWFRLHHYIFQFKYTKHSLTINKSKFLPKILSKNKDFLEKFIFLLDYYAPPHLHEQNNMLPPLFKASEKVPPTGNPKFHCYLLGMTILTFVKYFFLVLISLNCSKLLNDDDITFSE